MPGGVRWSIVAGTAAAVAVVILVAGLIHGTRTAGARPAGASSAGADCHVGVPPLLHDSFRSRR